MRGPWTSLGRGAAASVLASITLAAPLAGTAAATPGALDPSFDHSGMEALPLGRSVYANAAAVQPDGRIVTAGQEMLSTGKLALVSGRLLPNGRLDRSYGNDGWTTVSVGSTGGGTALAIERDGDILIAGGGRQNGSHPLGFAVVRLLPDGQLDPSFGHDGVATVQIGLAAIATSLAIQPDGKILLGGIVDNLIDSFGVARLNADGSLDQSFGSHGVTTFGSEAAAWGMALQPDGKIILGGETSPAGAASLVNSVLGLAGRRLEGGNEYMVARVLPDGKLDSSFGDRGMVITKVGIKALATAVALQPDGKIVLSGNAFTNTAVTATIRLLPDGGLDPTFGTGGVSAQDVAVGVNAVALQPDGKILLGATGPTAIRLNPDGSPDQSFGIDGVDELEQVKGNAANGITVQRSTGDIIMSGVATLSGHAELWVSRLRGS